MSDVSPESNQDSTTDTTPDGPSISERATDFMGQANEILGKVDWSQMGKYGKAAGIIAVVIIAQIIIKVVVDTVNFFPLLPGLLELLGIVVVGQWSWQNLTTSEKRNAVVEKVQNLRKEYID
ncbi:CAAD domain-containing protein [Prochlorococcus marinus]|uniref:CAAD domain-containing protein n=1 Tax=Prochlorococcus marinus TaxID=1219 RepID=UPI0022B3565E|nr:CAAD domain-containing protein [Prochlorococcus marinus]